jgi:hypothetical protein
MTRGTNKEGYDALRIVQFTIELLFLALILFKTKNLANPDDSEVVFLFDSNYLYGKSYIDIEVQLNVQQIRKSSQIHFAMDHIASVQCRRWNEYGEHYNFHQDGIY